MALLKDQQDVGVLRNSDGIVVGVFFGPLGIHDSNFAELMAILHALRLLSSPPYPNSHVTIEFDSKIAIAWVYSESLRPWDCWQGFNEIDALRRHLNHVSFTHILREGNIIDLSCKR